MKVWGILSTAAAKVREVFRMIGRMLPPLAAACVAWTLAACDEPAQTRVEPPPVVRQAPVETHPFEDGYDAGYALGLSKATREAKAPKPPEVPKPAEIEPLAREQAGEIPTRTERWQRGFVEGYLDGFRKVVTGQK